MKALKLIAFIVAFGAICLMPSFASAQTSDSTDGYTAVAGTDDVVMDRRAKNNVGVASGIIFAGFAVVIISVFSHVAYKQKKSKDISN